LIFDRFFRGRARAESGNGFGAEFVSRKSLRLHGGRNYGDESRRRAAANLNVTLPLATQARGNAILKHLLIRNVWVRRWYDWRHAADLASWIAITLTLWRKRLWLRVPARKR